MTTTDEILAIAASAVAAMDANAGVIAQPVARRVEVTQAHVVAFGRAAARGADSAVVRALLSVRPATPPQAAPLRDPAWDAWLSATAAMAAADGARAAGKEGAGGPVRPSSFAVFAVGTALGGAAGDPLVPVPAAVAAGLSAAGVVESGLADWGGWSSGTVAAGVGATVTAGLLLGLTQAQLRAALGIAATQAAGLAAAEATPAFALQVGKAAFNAVEAARLARSGFTAPADPLDGRRGLFALFG